MSRGTLRERVDEGLAQLGALVGERFRLDEHGLIGFAFEGGAPCTIEIAPEGDRACLYAEVARLPYDGDRTRLIEASLARNLFAVAPAGAWLALDASANSLLLCRSIPGDGFEGDILPELLMEMSTQAARLAQTLAAPAETIGPRPVASGEIFIRG